MSAARKGLVAGALSLAITGMITKILGLFYNVPFQNMAGDVALGHYNVAYNFYVAILQITTAGIPLAISKLISERNAKRDYAGADQIYHVGARYLTVAGLISFVVMYAISGVVAVICNDYPAVTSFRALSFALLIVPLMAAMRGYLQGHQAMATSGNSQVWEQAVRVFFSLIAVYIVVHVMKAGPNRDRYASAVATFGAVLGAVASIVFLSRRMVIMRRENRKKITRQATQKDSEVFRTIVKVSLPITLASLVLPLSQNIDSVTIMHLLKVGLGLSQDQAVAQFGIFSGRALRLVALPLGLATAVGLSLMPAISQAIAERNSKLTHERVLTAFRLTSFFAFPTSVGIFVLAKQIDVGLFMDTKGWDTIAMVSFMSIFSSYEMVTTYILQAFGFMYRPIRNMFAGMVLKLLLNLLLVPFLGIFGAAIASVFGYVLSSVMNLYSVETMTHVKMPIHSLYGKPLISSAIMGVVVAWIVKLPLVSWMHGHDRFANILLILLGAGVGALVFAVLMVAQKGLSKEEMRRLPILKRLVH